MNASIFLTSFFSNQWSGSNSFTSAAILVENCVVSNREMGATPLRPSQRPFHVSSVPVPSAVTKPTPVTTTLLFCKFRTSRKNVLRGQPAKQGATFLGFWKVVLDIFNSVFYSGDFFSLFVRNLQPKSFFERHHQFHRVQGIRAEIIDEGSCRRHFRFVHAELFNNDLFYLVFN